MGPKQVPTISFADVGRCLEGANNDEAQRHEQVVHDGDVHLPSLLHRPDKHVSMQSARVGSESGQREPLALQSDNIQAPCFRNKP
jgi:hypothetical protein